MYNYQHKFPRRGFFVIKLKTILVSQKWGFAFGSVKYNIDGATKYLKVETKVVICVAKVREEAARATEHAVLLASRGAPVLRHWHESPRALPPWRDEHATISARRHAAAVQATPIHTYLTSTAPSLLELHHAVVAHSVYLAVET